MPSFTRTVVASALLALVHAQGRITAVKGDSVTGLGLQVSQDDASDANFMSDAEIGANVVNECGRTLLAGNIDIGEQTENQLAAKQVTQVASGGTVAVTIDQANSNGTGPYACDLDLTSNANGLTGQTALKVTQDTTAGSTGSLNLKVALPTDMKCVGASTGDACTVRCRNAANFGGCFPVQQTDITAKKNTPANIPTAQTLAGVTSQVQQNQKDLGPAVSAIQGASLTEQSVKVADSILSADPVKSTANAAAVKLANAGTANTGTAAKAGGKKAKGAKGAAAAKAAGAATGTGATTAGTAAGATAKGKKGKGAAAAAAAAANNKRDGASGLRWAKRYVAAGQDFVEEGN